jgi:beta-glucosidase
LQVEFYENIGSCLCRFGFAKYNPGNMLDDAIALAKKSDIVILCLGLNEEWEGEAIDRDELTLPEDQLKLLDRILQVNKNVLIVLNNATPILMTDWINDVPGIIEAFYPGQEGGHALSDIIFGDVNPSGKLPITFPKRWEDSPVYETYPGTKELADYKEGIFVGYRHFDKHNIEPLFPFGYGLSYTTFEYSDLQISPIKVMQDDTVTVEVDIKNTGEVSGDEIVQLYIRDVEASVERESKSLRGFVRVSLDPGEKNTVTFKVKKTDLSFYGVKEKKWIAEPGGFEVLVGSSSRDIRLIGKFILDN